MPTAETDRRRAARRNLWAAALAEVSWAGKDVLDAGTGEGHCTQWLAERQPGTLTTISDRAEHQADARRRLGPLADRVAWRQADLTRMPEIPAGSFDVVVADFLIAAVAGHSPYREIDCLRELGRVLRPGGLLVLTGWEVPPTPRDPLDQAIRRLFVLREAASKLAGMTLYREHPAWWLEARLAELGLPAESRVEQADTHHDFRWFARQLRETLADLPAAGLRKALLAQVDELAAPVESHPAFAAGYPFGTLYAVRARQLAGGLLLA